MHYLLPLCIAPLLVGLQFNLYEAFQSHVRKIAHMALYEALLGKCKKIKSSLTRLFVEDYFLMIGGVDTVNTTIPLVPKIKEQRRGFCGPYNNFMHTFFG